MAASSAHFLVFLASLLLLALTYASAQGTVLDVLRNGTQFSDFVGSLNNSESLKARLANASLVSTVFAPVSQKKAYNLSEALLSYHISGSRYQPADLKDGDLVPSLLQLASLSNGNQQLKVSVAKDGAVSLNGVQLQSNVTDATNGVVYSLPSVLHLPGPLSHAVNGFSALKSRLAAAKVTFPTTGSTVFAPTDAAFADLKKTNFALYGYLNNKTNESLADLQLVLKYHVLPQVLYAQGIPVGSQQVNTLAGEPVTITKVVVNNTAEVALNSSTTTARVGAVNTLASDGVLHALNSVLVPNTFVFTLKKILVGLNDTTMLKLMRRADLTHCLTESCDYTIFAPTEDAWAKAEVKGYNKSVLQLTDVLKNHIYPHTLPNGLTGRMNLTMLSNRTLFVSNNSLTLDGYKRFGSTRAGNFTKGSNGNVYSIDKVLGVAVHVDPVGSTKIGWIIVGAMGGILFLAAVVVVAIWFLKRKRTDYEVING